MKSRSHRLPTISDTPDDWVDESWTVDCVCGVNFDDGEEMVDCDECGVWVHTRCSRYVKSEKLFSCDKCKSKKLRKESEETEVAQLLVELPTKTLRMENSYPMSCPPQSSFQVWTEIPLEEKVHVQGIPGGDSSLFSGVSSVFNQQLWKCTGYVPKKFNSQYREFPCWDERHDDDDDHEDDKDKELENPACKGANALFSLSTSGGIKSQVNGGGVLDMGPPTTDTKKQDVRKERSLLKPIVIHSGNHKKDDSKVVKDQNKKKNVKAMDKEGDSKKRSFESVSAMSSDAKLSESYEGKGHKVFKTDKQTLKHENSRMDVQDNHKSDDNVPLSSGKSSENVAIDDSSVNPSKEAKEMKEKDRNQVPASVEISDGMASSLKQNPTETSTIKDEVNHDVVDDANDNGRSCSTGNGTQPSTTNLDKEDLTQNADRHTAPLSPIEENEVETSLPVKTSNHQNSPTSDSKLDSSKSSSQDTKPSDDRLSPSFEVKKEFVSVSHSQIHKVQNLDKTLPNVDTQLEGPPKSHGTTANPSGAPNQRKITGKPSSTSSKPSVPEKPRSSNTDDRSSSGKQKGTSENNNKIKKDNVDVSEKPKKFVKELPKSSSTSALKSSHLSKSSHAPVPKKNSSDSKDPAILSSSKTATTLDSGDSANSLRCESGGANEQNKSTSESSQKGEKISQINRQPAIKNHPSHVHPPPSTNLSDEELALLLHQELNSSPRVPRVPRMRHAGSLPQLASTTPTSTLMKRTSSSGGKDNNGPRKRNKDLTNNGREHDGAKKGDKMPSVPTSRRHELVKNGSTNKSVPPVSTTASSGPSSSNEANEHNMLSPQNASDDEVPTHRTLPGLIAEIMSKGKRMAYEELCNAVLPHWPNLRKHNGERYAYSSHSQAVLDCLRNRSEWSRLVDRGPKTNAGRKRRKSEADTPNVESEEEEDDDDYSTDRNTKDVDNNNKNLGDEFPKGKRKARKHRRLAMQGTRIKRRRKAEVVSDDDIDSSSSDSSEENAFSDEGGRTSAPNEASASSES